MSKSILMGDEGMQFIAEFSLLKLVGVGVVVAVALLFGTGCRASLSTNEIHAPNMDVVDVHARSAFTDTRKRVLTTTDELPPQAGMPGYGGYGYGRGGYPGRGPYYGGGYPPVVYPTIVVARVASFGTVPAPSATLVVAPVPQSAPQQPAQSGEVKDTKVRDVVKDMAGVVTKHDERLDAIEEKLGGKTDE